MMRYVVICSALVAACLGAPSAANQEYQPSLMEEAYGLYSSCSGQDLAVCLKLKALGYVDRAVRSAEISVLDGFKIVRSDDAKSSSRADNARSLNDIESSLPAEPEARESAVDEAIIDRTARFLQTHTVEISNPETESAARSLSEARTGKKKKTLKALIPFLLLLKLKAVALAPLLLGGLALLAFKALVVGKIALIISAILAFQKLLGNKQPNYEVVHPVAHDEHHEHAWARAYHAQKPAQATN